MTEPNAEFQIKVAERHWWWLRCQGEDPEPQPPDGIAQDVLVIAETESEIPTSYTSYDGGEKMKLWIKARSDSGDVELGMGPTETIVVYRNELGKFTRSDLETLRAMPVQPADVEIFNPTILEIPRWDLRTVGAMCLAAADKLDEITLEEAIEWEREEAVSS